MDSLLAKYSFYDKKTIPAETYRGQTQPFHCLNVGNMTLVASEATDNDTVYHFTKTLFENAPQVVEKHPAGRAINPKNVIRQTGTPFHSGAIRYFKEIGIWPMDNTESSVRE